MLIGILQTGLAPDVLVDQSGDYPDMFARLLAGQGFTFRTYRVVDGEFPASVTECDGWLITGSRHGVYEDHAFIPPLETFIRNAYAAHVPMVGICVVASHKTSGRLVAAVPGRTSDQRAPWQCSQRNWRVSSLVCASAADTGRSAPSVSGAVMGSKQSGQAATGVSLSCSCGPDSSPGMG